MDDKMTKKHTINMVDRKRLVITAVKDVFSFDEEVIELETISDGYMDIEGQDLHIIKMNLDSGELIVEGEISGIIYEEADTPKKKGTFFSQIFK
ncbi:MAG: sporulation protein [Epulopiscium sp. Nele67-Bin004]|nr:MAG: sporulation protein [Epulopiscium sp. Nele67-Bin004]